MEELIWYDMDVKTGDELRTILSNRKDKSEQALISLNISSIDYINNFTDYVTLNNEILCNALFRNKLPYIIGNIIGKGKVGQVALLTHNQVKLIIKSMSAKAPNYLSLRIIDYPSVDVNFDNSYWKIYSEDNVRKIIAVGGDNFSNQTSMHLILNLILGDSPYYIHQYDAFYCDGIGHNVIEFSNSGDLHGFLETNKINDELLFGVISHVLVPLATLKHPMYNFNHSDLKAKNVFVNRTDQGYTFKIADYDKSSITWNGYRFYNWSQNYGTAYPITIQKDLKGSDVYMLSSMVALQLYTMHNPYGVPMSYDIYTFIISLFAIDTVWNAYVNEELPRFKQLMHKLFVGELYYDMMGKIAADHEAVVSISHINSLINGMYLQHDISYVYDMAGIQPPPLYIDDSNKQTIVVSKDGHLCVDSCGINPDNNTTYKTCTTNNYSKTGFTGSSTIYNWDYC